MRRSRQASSTPGLEISHLASLFSVPTQLQSEVGDVAGCCGITSNFHRGGKYSEHTVSTHYLIISVGSSIKAVPTETSPKTDGQIRIGRQMEMSNQARAYGSQR